MQIQEIRPNTPNKKRKRIARGGSHGKTSGRGEKGQRSRSGRTLRPALRDFIKKFPKKRGYRFETIDRNAVSLNVGRLNIFSNGETVNPYALVRSGLITKRKNIRPKVKILGTGDLKKKILLQGCVVSVVAQEKIVKAGGEIKL